MGVFELHSTDQVRDLVPGTERRRPVGDGQSGIIAGYEGASNDENERPAGKDQSQPVVVPVVQCGDGFQNRVPLVQQTAGPPIEFRILADYINDR